MLYMNKKITCALSFKKSVVRESTSAQFHVKVEGKCVECDGNLNGYIYSKLVKNKDVIMHFELFNAPANFIHTKRSQLRGDVRVWLVSLLTLGNQQVFG